MSEISIWPLRKTRLSTCWQSQRSAVSCSWPPGLITSQERFWPTPLQILSKSLRFRGWRLATRTFSSLHRFSMGLRFGDWLGHSRTLMCFFLSHTFVALSCVLGHCHTGIPTHDPFSMLWLASMPWPWRYMTPPIVSLSSCPVPLAEKHPQACFNLHIWRWGWCSWGHRQHSSSSKHGELSWCQRAGFWSHRTTALSPSTPLNHWKTSDGLYMCFLEQGTLQALQDCSPSLSSVLTIVFLVTMVPAALRSLTRSSRVVLGYV